MNKVAPILIQLKNLRHMYINKESHILISTPHKPIYLGIFLKADLKRGGNGFSYV